MNSAFSSSTNTLRFKDQSSVSVASPRLPPPLQPLPLQPRPLPPPPHLPLLPPPPPPHPSHPLTSPPSSLRLGLQHTGVHIHKNIDTHATCDILKHNILPHQIAQNPQYSHLHCCNTGTIGCSSSLSPVSFQVGVWAGLCGCGLWFLEASSSAAHGVTMRANRALLQQHLISNRRQSDCIRPQQTPT